MHDKTSNEVEPKYKVADGKCNLYTLNMYNTTSSCLINGKKPGHFFNTDIPQILDIVDSELVLNCTTVSGVYDALKQQILNYIEKKSSENLSSHMFEKSSIMITKKDENAHGILNIQINHPNSITMCQL